MIGLFIGNCTYKIAFNVFVDMVVAADYYILYAFLLFLRYKIDSPTLSVVVTGACSLDPDGLKVVKALRRELLS